MIKNKEWVGDWVIKMGVNERHCQGRLSYTVENGCILSVYSPERQFIDILFVLSDEVIPVILGKTHTGQSLTLLNSIVNQVAPSEGSGLTFSIQADFVIEGLHYQEENSLLFNATSIELASLRGWLGLSSQRPSIRDGSYQDDTRLLSDLKPTVYQIGEGLNLSFFKGLFPIVSETTEGGFHAHLFSSDQNLLFKDWLKKVQHFRRLVSLLYGYPCFVTSLVIHDHMSSKNKNSYTVYYKNITEGFPNEYISPSSLLLPFNKVGPYLDALVKRWFEYEKSDDLEYVSRVVSKSTRRYSEEIFLEFARGIEVFHRVLTSSPICTKSEKKRFRKNVYERITITDFLPAGTVPEDATTEERERFSEILKKIKSALDYLDEPSFRWRTNNIVDKIKANLNSEVFERLFPAKMDIANSIVDYRNYFTHYDKSSRNKVGDNLLPIALMVKLMLRTKILLTLLVLDDLSVPIPLVAEQLQRKVSSGPYNIIS